MAVLTAMPMSFWIILGIVGISGFALLFTAYRYLLIHFLLGMVCWLMVEGFHWVLQSFVDISNVVSYFIALALSLSIIASSIYWLNKEVSLKDKPRVNVGNRPFDLKNDTNISANCVRHRSVSETRH